MNNQHLKELSEELYRISTESARLLYYVSLLPNLQAEVITFHYLEGNTVSQTSKKIDASEASVKNMLRTAVKELVHMYNYIRTRN